MLKKLCLLFMSISIIFSVNLVEAASSQLTVEKPKNENIFIKINYENEYGNSEFVVRWVNGWPVAVSNGETNINESFNTQVSVNPILLKDTEDLLLKIIARIDNVIIFDGYFKTTINNSVTINNSNMKLIVTPVQSLQDNLENDMKSPSSK